MKPLYFHYVINLKNKLSSDGYYQPNKHVTMWGDTDIYAWFFNKHLIWRGL